MVAEGGSQCRPLRVPAAALMLRVELDARPLEQWAKELSARGLRNALRRGVDQSATAARKIALDVIAKDIGVPRARIKSAVSKVKRTTMGDLSASFTASKMRIGILATGATVTRPGGLRGSTFRLTGGGSTNLNVPNAFIITANGGRFVAIRRGPRYPLKAIYAEHPATALGQDGAAAQTAWRKSAQAELAKRLPLEISKQLKAEGLPYVASPDLA